MTQKASPDILGAGEVAGRRTVVVEAVADRRTAEDATVELEEGISASSLAFAPDGTLWFVGPAGIQRLRAEDISAR